MFFKFISYKKLYEHKKENHSDEFIMEDCKHTNTFDDTWLIRNTWITY